MRKRARAYPAGTASRRQKAMVRNATIRLLET
jgi:hypothetical protein